MKRSAATSNAPIDLMNSPANVQAPGSTRERPGRVRRILFTMVPCTGCPLRRFDGHSRRYSIVG
ncbi:hypothetical protein P692DRAFT_20592541 [Suillus brevipes Sb2]|nr:hypothetical protein P692DRAFT_20592541 [Suillus brevipes Sb2]